MSLREDPIIVRNTLVSVTASMSCVSLAAKSSAAKDFAVVLFPSPVYDGHAAHHGSMEYHTILLFEQAASLASSGRKCAGATIPVM